MPTFTFAASALSSVSHCSSVWASIQNQQLLCHSVVIAAGASRQRWVWGKRRFWSLWADSVMRIDLPGKGRKRKCERRRTVSEGKGTWLRETDSICNLLKINISSWWTPLCYLVSQEASFPQLLQRKTTGTEILLSAPFSNCVKSSFITFCNLTYLCVPYKLIWREKRKAKPLKKIQRVVFLNCESCADSCPTFCNSQ